MNKFQLKKQKKVKLVKDLIDFIMELPTLLLVVKCIYALDPRTRPDLPVLSLDRGRKTDAALLHSLGLNGNTHLICVDFVSLFCFTASYQVINYCLDGKVPNTSSLFK